MATPLIDVAHIQLVRGDDLRIYSPVVDADGEPVDISGASEIRWAIGRNDNDPQAIAEKTLGVGVAIVNSTTYYVDIDAALTADLEETVYWPELRAAFIAPHLIGRREIARSYWHQVRLTTSAGKKHTILCGRLFIRPTMPEVT